MSSSTLTPVPHDGRMDPSQPRFGGYPAAVVTPEEDVDCMAILALKWSRHDGLYKAPDGDHVNLLSFGQTLSH